MPDTDIIMYARERHCPDVSRSRAHLTALGHTWIEYDIEADSDAAESLLRLAGRTNVPTILVGDAVLIEPSNDELDDALREAGFSIDTA